MQKLMTIHGLQDLKVLPQWVYFTPEKIPLSPRTRKGAKSNDPTTWGDFRLTACIWRELGARCLALGFAFCKEQELMGIDLDHCIVDGGIITPLASEVVARLNSYCEYSPSGTGLHILVRGRLPENLLADLKADGEMRLEMYDHNHFLTVTGKHLAGTPDNIKERGSCTISWGAVYRRKPQRSSGNVLITGYISPLRTSVLV